MDPCTTTPYVVHVITGLFAGANTLLITWLVDRRKRADEKRMAFYAAMLDKHNGWSNYESALAEIRKPKRQR
jgi:hypothetical protein